MKLFKTIDGLANAIIGVGAVVGAVLLVIFNIMALIVAIVIGAAWRK